MNDEKPDITEDIPEDVVEDVADMAGEPAEDTPEDTLGEIIEDSVAGDMDGDGDAATDASDEMDSAASDTSDLSDIEKSAIGEICDLIMASLAKDFGERMASTIGMEPSTVSVIGLETLGSAIATPVLLVQLSFSSSLEGQLFLFINGDGLPRIFDLAIPDEAKELGADDDVILDGLRTIAGQAVSDATVNLSASMGCELSCSVIDVTVLQDGSGFESISFMYPEGKLLDVSTSLMLPEGSVFAGFLLPVGLSNQMIDLLLNEQPAYDSGESASIDEYTTGLDAPDASAIESTETSHAPEAAEVTPVHDMQPARFNAISGEPGSGGDTSNISLLLDVPLDASIELGKTQMTIEEILRLAKGSVIELDKLASEPVEFLVNGKVIARGEVVVIDDNFGIRITEILSARLRLESI